MRTAFSITPPSIPAIDFDAKAPLKETVPTTSKVKHKAINTLENFFNFIYISSSNKL